MNEIGVYLYPVHQVFGTLGQQDRLGINFRFVGRRNIN